MDCFLFSLEFFGRDNGTLIYLSTVRTSRCVCQCVEDYWETKGKSRHCPETAMYVISVSLASISVYLDAWLKKILFPIKRFSSPPSAQNFRNRKKLFQLDLRAIRGRNPLACRVILSEKKILMVSLAEWTYVLVPSAKKIIPCRKSCLANILNPNDLWRMEILFYPQWMWWFVAHS